MLTGALVLGGASGAVADDIRDRQWDLKAFDAEGIWEHSTGKGTTVAVVDSGVDAKHRDLTGRVLEGKDFTGSGDDARTDSDGHGTQVAGVIAAHGHGAGQGSGMRGLAPDAKILPVKAEETASKADAIQYAVDQDVDVINLSYSTIKDPNELKAVNDAISKGVVVVAETGDEGIQTENFPAAYPGVVSVGAIDREG